MSNEFYITPDGPRFSEEQARILVVDDFEANLELMTAILEKEGFRVIASKCQFEVLKRIKELAPDLAVLDVMMPGMSGYELCRRLKESFGKKFFPVVLVTGLSQLEDKLAGLEAGADDFFSKPFNSREMLAKIRSLLKLRRLQDELESAEDIIFTLAMTVEAKDKYTRGHSERVSALSSEVASRLGLAEKDILCVRKGGILHDIGKIAVHEEILHKKAALSLNEVGQIRAHPITGFEICKTLSSLKKILPIIKHHHERWDGGGFPDGLKGEAIPLIGRIVSVADAFDAMVSVRPYRDGYTVEGAIRIIKNEKDSGQWDPLIVATFIEMVESDITFVRNLYPQ